MESQPTALQSASAVPLLTDRPTGQPSTSGKIGRTEKTVWRKVGLAIGSVWMVMAGGLLPQSGITGAASAAPASEPIQTGPAGTSLSDVRFSCQVINGDYTVVYSPQSQPGQVYPWAKPALMGGGLDARKSLL